MALCFEHSHIPLLLFPSLHAAVKEPYCPFASVSVFLSRPLFTLAGYRGGLKHYCEVTWILIPSVVFLLAFTENSNVRCSFLTKIDVFRSYWVNFKNLIDGAPLSIGVCFFCLYAPLTSSSVLFRNGSHILVSMLSHHCGLWFSDLKNWAF